MKVRLAHRVFAAGCLLVATALTAAAVYGIARIPIITDFGWQTQPDYYAGPNAHLKARYTPGTDVRTSATGKIHLINATFDWEREAYDHENFMLVIVGAEQPRWELTVTNDYSLDVNGDGYGLNWLTYPGQYWHAQGTHYHYCRANGDYFHHDGYEGIVQSFPDSYPDPLLGIFRISVSPTVGIDFGSKTIHSGQIKRDPAAWTDSKDIPGAILELLFASKTVARLKEMPYGPTQLQSVSVDVNMAASADGTTGNVGRYRGVAIAYDGNTMIDKILVP